MKKYYDIEDLGFVYEGLKYVGKCPRELAYENKLGKTSEQTIPNFLVKKNIENIKKEYIKHYGLEKEETFIEHPKLSKPIKYNFYKKRKDIHILIPYKDGFWAKNYIEKKKEIRTQDFVELMIILEFKNEILSDLENIKLHYINRNTGEETVTIEKKYGELREFNKYLNSFYKCFGFIEKGRALKEYKQEDAEDLKKLKIIFSKDYKKLNNGETVYPFQCKNCEYSSACIGIK